MTPSPFLAGFRTAKAALAGTTIHYAIAGEGPALLLLHGHPQTHIVWRKIAPQFVAAGYQVIAPDLRGYGDSGKPQSDETHAAYSKRAMAQDMAELLHHLGIQHCAVIGHDRGGRVAHRMALDHPEAVTKIAVLDIAPTRTMYERTDQEFATRYFWWFFLIQPYDFPEKMIGQDPEYFLRRHIAGQVKIPDVIEEDVMCEYVRCYQNPETIHAICEDYRAAASIDLVHDKHDEDKRITAPLMAIWGEQSVVGQLYDVSATWQDKADNVRGVALACGHALPEEKPDMLFAKLIDFLADECQPT